MVCDIIDFRCIFVNEIAGTVFMASLLGVLFYFMISSKMNWGFTTTIGFLIPIAFVFSLAISGFSAVMAFGTIIVGFMLAWIVNKLLGNR